VIVRHVGDTAHADREALALWLGLSQMTVRRHCKPDIVGLDAKTGRVLYDAQRTADRLERITGRPYLCIEKHERVSA
jgi:hypothetical protein